MKPAVDFLVSRQDLRQTRFEERAPATLAPGQVRLAVDRFALTANNITYAVFGDAMQYWKFFPAPDGWGRVPVWGWAEVAESRVDGIAPGERVYGYLPMSTELIVQPEKVSAQTFMDATPCRRPLPSPYQQYQRGPGASPAQEDFQAILQPLLVTSFLIADFLDENGLFGARQVVLASASSKTALGVAFLLSRRPGCEVIGLTSPRNRAFCEGLGYYSRVVAYDELASLATDVPTVFVDMAGDGKLLHDVHHHFRDALKHSCIVGATHWENRATQHALPGAKPQFFFAPTRIQKRTADWGPGGVQKHFAAAWQQFMPSIGAWLKVRHGRGKAAVEAAYREVLENRSEPQEARVVSVA